MSIGGPERIWFRDPNGFFAEDRLAHFLPQSNTSLAVQLNALLRLAIYAAVLMVLFRRYSLALYIPAGMAVLTYLLFVSVPTPSTSTGVEGLGQTREGVPCTVPTIDNPFMNVLLGEYSGDPNRRAACDLSAGAAAASTDSLFQNNLFRDVDDVFNRRSSSHNFYTTPNTQVPNDQGAFARWCYETGPTFKEEGLEVWAPNLQGDSGGPGTGNSDGNNG